MQKLYSMLGLARRAGKLLVGRDSVMASVKKGRVRLVLLTRDASPRHRQELEALGYRGELITANCTMLDLAAAIGKKSCIVALEDENFTNAIQHLI